jgi:NADH-quinone oxidoreductase subunit C/D
VEQSLKEKIQNKFLDSKVVLGVFFVSCPLAQARETLAWLKEEAGFIFLVDLTALDHGPDASQRFEVKYNLLNLEEHLRILLGCSFDTSNKSSLPDIRDLWTNTDWPSRELWDMFGLSYAGQNCKRVFNSEQHPGHPLLKDFQAPQLEDLLVEECEEDLLSQDSVWSKGEKTYWQDVKASPRGASLIGLKYFEKEKLIQSARVEIGYSHKGIEKLCENTPYHLMTRWTSKLNSLCSETINTTWLRSVEGLCGLEVPEKSQAMRMVVLELDRIKSHLSALRHAIREAGLSDLTDLLTMQIEKLFQLSFSLTKRRLNSEFVCLGGVRNDYPHGWRTDCLKVLKQADKCIQEVHRQLIRSHQWMERTKSAHITPYEALDWGLSGPSLRACGVNFDLRKVDPIYFYGDVDFQVPLGINGDSYDRFLVRIEEVFQSIAIVNQILDHIPGGDFYDQEQVDSLKDLSGEITVPAGQIYTALEAPNGELGVGLVANGSGLAERVRFRTPSFYCAQAIEAIFSNLHWDQAWMTVHSFNLDHSEVDK